MPHTRTKTMSLINTIEEKSKYFWTSVFSLHTSVTCLSCYEILFVSSVRVKFEVKYPSLLGKTCTLSHNWVKYHCKINETSSVQYFYFITCFLSCDIYNNTLSWLNWAKVYKIAFKITFSMTGLPECIL